MKLKLTRPVAAFDLETTGPKPLEDKIIELAIIKIMPDGTKEDVHFLLNPGCDIPEAATAVHGIKNEDVALMPTFETAAKMIADILTGCDFITYNGNSFDIPMLAAEFERAKVPFDFEGVGFIDVGNLYKIFAPRTLEAAVMQYLGVKHEGAHGAIADTQATINVLFSMVDTHAEEIPLDVQELALKSNYGRRRLDLAGKFAYNDKGEVIFTFGKNKGNPIETDLGYIKWMLEAKNGEGKYSFTEDTRNVCLKLLGRGNMVNHKGPVQLPKYAPEGLGGQRFKRY